MEVVEADANLRSVVSISKMPWIVAAELASASEIDGLEDTQVGMRKAVPVGRYCSMNKNKDLPKLVGYVSVKEAAEMLGLSDSMIYYHIQNKRLHAVRLCNVLLITPEELESFKQKWVGRPKR